MCERLARSIELSARSHIGDSIVSDHHHAGHPHHVVDGFSILIFVFIKTIFDAAKKSYADPPNSIFGIGTVLFIGH